MVRPPMHNPYTLPLTALSVKGEVPERGVGRRLRILQRYLVCPAFHDRRRRLLTTISIRVRDRSGWDIHDLVYPNELLISNRANGYKDLLAQIDLTTFRRIPWENNVPFFLVLFLDPDTKEPICADPRGVLKKVVERAQSKGFQCYAGCEYEVSRPRFAMALFCSSDLVLPIQR